MVTFCCRVTPALRAHAEVMATSLRRHHPGARLVAVLAGAEEELSSHLWEPADLPPGASIPALLVHVLNDSDIAIYVECDVCFYATVEPVLAAVERSGVALVRRLNRLPDDDRRPDYTDLVAAGRTSTAMVAVADGDEASAFLNWWSRHREDSDLPDGAWLTLAREEFPSVATVEDPGCNVSFWNLHERPLSRSREQILVAGQPLRFIHFEGFRPDRPYWLADDATRVRVLDDPLLAEMCGEYAERVRDAGWSPLRLKITGVDRLGDGQRVDHLVRALWEDALREGRHFGDPLSERGASEFVAWMREPVADKAGAGVTRYLHAAYESRPDLQRVFPDIEGADGERLLAWGRAHRLEVLPELVEPLSGDGAAEPSGLGVNVIGFLGETLGLAEAARLYVTALQAADIAVTTTAVSPDRPAGRGEPTVMRHGSGVYEDLRSATEPGFNLACVNGDHLAALVGRLGEELLQGLPTIGQWGWETDVLPPSWEASYGFLREVWVYSTFMAENLGRLLPMPVVVVPPAIVTPDPAGAELPIPADDRFTFLFMLDFFSTLRRKNPVGLVDAFIRAFEPGEGPRLLIKTLNASFRPEAADELRYRIGDRPDIDVVDLYLDARQKAALLARADCYVSLHRSEGFGLPLAESMSLGTPVITTGYSGNMDFTSAHNSYLVDWSPARVGPDCEIYPPEGTWAEPDLDHAAELLRRVWEHPEEAARKGRRAQTDIRMRYAPEVVGAIARARLERLRDLEGTGNASAGSVTELARIEQALRFDLRRGIGPMPRGPAGLLRRVVLRLILPFTFHEREVDQGVFAALQQLRAEIGRLRAQNRRDRRRLHRLEETLDDALRLRTATPDVTDDELSIARR